MPGVPLTGAAPTYKQYTAGTPGYNLDKNNFAPLVGVAWQPNVEGGWLRTILGDPGFATLRGSYTTYDQTPELDRPSLDGKVTGRLDVTRDTSLIGEGTLVVGTDNPGSPNVQAGVTRFPIFTTLGASAGVTQRFNRVEVTVKGTAERT